MRLKVYASLAEDINNGWVWVPESIVSERVVIKVKNCDSGRSVYCEVIPFGDNFVSRYNQGNRYSISDRDASVVVNEWYRKKLGIGFTQTDCEFQIKRADNPYGHLKASLQHPQIVVRLAMEFSIVGLVLGIVGLVLGFISLRQ